MAARLPSTLPKLDMLVSPSHFDGVLFLCQPVTESLIYLSVVVAAKSTSDAAKVDPFPPNPNSSQSTISTVEREIREAGGEATAIPVDVREYESVQRLVAGTIEACWVLVQ